MAHHTPLAEIARDLLALVWPTACVNCGDPDRDCCLPCLVEIERPSPLIVLDIGCPVYARAPYDGALRAALVAFKHDGRTGFTHLLGQQLRLPLEAALALCSGAAAPVLVTMPSRRSSSRRRGYRHVEVLLSSALRGRRLRCLRVAALAAGRGRLGQVGLDAAERLRNAQRIRVRASARAALRGREVVLIDDIVTTGASVVAARDALEAAGAHVVAVVALCRAMRLDDKPGDTTVSAGLETETRSGVEFGKGVTVRHSGTPA